MISGLRRFAVTNSNGRRSLIASPYANNSNRFQVVAGSQSEHVERGRRNRGLEVNSAFDSPANNGGGFGAAQTVVGKNVAIGMLEEFIPNDRHIRNRIFRDIYYHDAVGGGAVDIYATLPWSDFYLTGLQDRDALDVYHKSVESMRLKILLPAITRDYLVLGTFIGSTVYDREQNIFSAVMPQNVDFCLVGETKVLTSNGWQTIFELARPRDRKNFPILYQVNGEYYKGSTPYYTGHKSVYQVNLHNGQHITGTREHKLLTYEYKSPGNHRYVECWKQIGDLKPGDKVTINSYQPPEIAKTTEFYEALFIGALMGDGTVRVRSANNHEYPEIVLFGKKRRLLRQLEKAGVVKHSYPRGDGGIFVLLNHRAKELLHQYKFQNKKSVQITNLTQFCGYLSGLIATDGNVSTDINIGGGEYLYQVLDWLLQYGCAHGRIRVAAIKGAPSGDGELTKDHYSLHFGKTDCRKLLPNLWLRKDQRRKLTKLLGLKSLQKLPFTKVVDVKYVGRRDVYDIAVPKIHRFIANGVVAHNCEIVEVPIYGMDPLITLKVPEATRKLFSNAKDPRAVRILDSLPRNMADSFRGGEIPLEPESTLYIPRRTLSSDAVGTSYYERILPVHLMEKALFKGSIDQAYRRQRAILHITMSGEGDDYVPTLQDMEHQRDMWMTADMDPTGSIVVTPGGVQPNEVRDASSFWRIDEVFDFLVTAKYRALSINEAFITGDASYNTVDASMSVFIESMRAFRGMLTQEIFYEKIFPAIALANDFTREEFQTLGRAQRKRRATPQLETYFNGQEYVTYDRGRSGQRYFKALCDDTRHGLNIHNKQINIEDLAVPHISWQKHLRPEGDQAYLEMLATMQEKGIPVPMAAMAMAGGLDIYAVLNSMDEELKLRKRMKKYTDKLAEFMPQQQAGDDGQGGGMSTAARALEAAAALASRSGIKRPIGLFGREFDERLLPHYQHKNGNYRTTTGKGQRQQYEKIARRLSKVMAAKAEEENYHRKTRRHGKRSAMVHARLGVIK